MIYYVIFVQDQYKFDTVIIVIYSFIHSCVLAWIECQLCVRLYWGVREIIVPICNDFLSSVGSFTNIPLLDSLHPSLTPLHKGSSLIWLVTLECLSKVQSSPWCLWQTGSYVEPGRPLKKNHRAHLPGLWSNTVPIFTVPILTTSLLLRKLPELLLSLDRDQIFDQCTESELLIMNWLVSEAL